VDLLRWIAGEPIEVYAHHNHKSLLDWPTPDTAIAIYKFPNDVMGKVFVSTGCKRNYTMRSVFYGTKGTIICDNTSDHITIFTTDQGGSTKPLQTLPIQVNNHNAQGELEVFIKAIETGEKIETDAWEGAATVTTCLAIVESSTKGTPITPNYKFD
jgi:predicted dehydrogenase